MSNHENKNLKIVVKGAGIIFLGTFLGYLINFFYRLIVSRYFGPSDYGLISLGEMVLNFGAIISLFGLHEALIRYTSYYKAKEDFPRLKGVFYSTVKLAIPFGIIMSFLLIFFSDFISSVIFKSPEFKHVLIVFAMALPLYIFLKLMDSFFLALKNAKYKELVEIIFAKFSNLIMVVIVVFFAGSILDVSFAYLVSLLIASILAFFIYRKVSSKKLFFKTTTAVYSYKQVITFSIPLLFTGVFVKIMGWADTFFLGVFQSTYDVGIYNVSFQLAASMGMFLVCFGQIYFPLATGLLAKNKIGEIGKIFEVIIRWVFMISFPIFLLILLFSKEILKYLFGHEYVAGSLSLIILTSAYFLNIITGPGIHTLKSFKKLKFIFNLNLIIVALNLILNIYLIPLYGVVGAAIATAISIILRELCIFFKVKHLTKFSYHLVYYLKYIFSGLLSLGIVYFILRSFFRPYSFIVLIIAFIVFGMLYCLFLLFFRSFKQEDIFVLLAIESKLGLNLKFIKKILKKFV